MVSTYRVMVFTIIRRGVWAVFLVELGVAIYTIHAEMALCHGLHPVELCKLYPMRAVEISSVLPHW
jgi:hypothetical protein